MMLLAANPALTMAVGSVYVCAIALGGGVVAAKERWKWLAIGLLTLGVLWPILAVKLVARPDSLWAQAFYTPDKMARARRKFPRRASS
jgi:hypothetical protein